MPEGPMLTVDLLRLWRERKLPVRGSIGPDAELWKGSGITFAEAVEVTGTASVTADGAVLVRGSWKAVVEQECGRCLDELRLRVEKPMSLLYMPQDRWESAEHDDPDTRLLDDRANTLDLKEAIREEVLLEAPRYLLPAEGEDGRCTECGRTVETFRRDAGQEDATDADPRWAALRALQPDSSVRSDPTTRSDQPTPSDQPN